MKTLQVGLEWLPERTGGLPRYFHDLLGAAPGRLAAGGWTLVEDPAEADVALVTCGGEFVEDAGTSTENTVVFATVVR